MAQLYKKKKFKNIKGFTLVELVIVIAVITILATVLVPTFSNVVEKANASSDISLVRNINNTLVLYSVDNETPKTKDELKNVIRLYGINEFKNKAQNHIFYFIPNDCITVIWGIKEERIIYPEYYTYKGNDLKYEINLSNNEVKNMVTIAKKLIDPNNKGSLYVDGFRDNTIINKSKTTNITSNGVGGFVATGVILLSYPEIHNLKIYIYGAEIVSGNNCRIHLIKTSNYNDVTEIFLNDDQMISKCGLRITKLQEKYYVIECVDIDVYNTLSNKEDLYYALSLQGNGSDLIITHNEEILNID